MPRSPTITTSVEAKALADFYVQLRTECRRIAGVTVEDLNGDRTAIAALPAAGRRRSASLSLRAVARVPSAGPVGNTGPRNAVEVTS